MLLLYTSFYIMLSTFYVSLAFIGPQRKEDDTVSALSYYPLTHNFFLALSPINF